MKVWVVTFGLIARPDDEEFSFHDRVIAVCSSSGKAKAIAQQYVVEQLAWCDDQRQDYLETCTPSLHPTPELAMDEDESITDLYIQGYELDIVPDIVLTDGITTT